MTSRVSAERAKYMVALLDAWPNHQKLTWDTFLSECQNSLNFSYSRQALCRHWVIAEAFARNKERIKATFRSSDIKGLTMQKAGERIKRLEAKIEQLERANEALLEQFVRWAYNASNMGLSENYLNTPLPVNDRNPSLLK